MSYKRRAVAAFIGAAGSAMLVILFFSLAAQGEENWKYAWDEDLRESVEFLRIIGWCFVVIAVTDVIQGIAYSLAHQKNEDEENERKAEQRNYHPGPAAANTAYCSFCNYPMSRNASKCLHCGTPVSRSVPDRGSSQAYMSVPGLMGVESRQTKKCLFCGELMTERQTFCGACGRRQD